MKTRKKISARLLAIMLIAALLLPLAWNVEGESSAVHLYGVDAVCQSVVAIQIEFSLVHV